MDYLAGFGNYFQTECMPNVILPGHNSPQKVPYGLYAEQISGSAFTLPRHLNARSWLYRLLPSVKHQEFKLLSQEKIQTAPTQTLTPPTQMRWNPLPSPAKNCDFLRGITTLVVNGNAKLGVGGAMHLYACNQSMVDYFYNGDGELLFIPVAGRLNLKTEMGILELAPEEIAIIPRGIKFQVELLDAEASGYLAENYGMLFRLPELGILGANALANPRDFLYPVAHFEEKTGNFNLITKFSGALWQAPIDHSPLNVVAWHGNYAPYKYNLKLFNTVNTVSFDHPDPSIFTVLHSPSAIPGMANLDFVIFPERWMVAEETFRPPYYHRNQMSELMGLIKGVYDAKQTGFVPGGSSLHNCMAAHGPDAEAYEHALNEKLAPKYYHGTLAFMLESCYVWEPTKDALNSSLRQKDYLTCWEKLKNNFRKIV